MLLYICTIKLKQVRRILLKWRENYAYNKNKSLSV